MHDLAELPPGHCHTAMAVPAGRCLPMACAFTIFTPAGHCSPVAVSEAAGSMDIGQTSQCMRHQGAVPSCCSDPCRTSAGELHHTGQRGGGGAASAAAALAGARAAGAAASAQPPALQDPHGCPGRSVQPDAAGRCHPSRAPSASFSCSWMCHRLHTSGAVCEHALSASIQASAPYKWCLTQPGQGPAILPKGSVHMGQ